MSPVYKLNIIENNLLSPRSAGDVQSDVITVPNESAPRSAPQNRAPSADGDLDASFNPNASECFGFVEEAIAQPDGKVIIGGLYSGVNGAPRSYLARINADSSLDATFNPGRSGTERDGSRPGSSTER